MPTLQQAQGHKDLVGFNQEGTFRQGSTSVTWAQSPHPWLLLECLIRGSLGETRGAPASSQGQGLHVHKGPVGVCRGSVGGGGSSARLSGSQWCSEYGPGGDFEGKSQSASHAGYHRPEGNGVGRSVGKTSGMADVWASCVYFWVKCSAQCLA